MAENPRLVLGLKVRSLRHRRQETLQSLSERSGLSVSYLSEIEKGKKYPKPERLVQLAEALGVPFDELVSLQVEDDLSQLKAAFDSPLLRGFPFDLFGLEPEDVLALVSGDPQRGSALLRAVSEVGRSYDVNVEHFLLAALRSYQQLHANYFDELETEALRFRRERGWEVEQPIDDLLLEEVLREQWGYVVDRETLGEISDLTRLRSVYDGSDRPTLFINPQLMASQRAFVLAREIGYRRLGLSARAKSSPWLDVESFDQVFNNFKASYFAGALLIDRRRFERHLRDLFGTEEWSPRAVDELMRRYTVTPESFLHRLTQIAPKEFGLGDFYFLRFNSSGRNGGFRLTKWLNTSSVALPRGFGLSEHHCRRWPALRLLNEKLALTNPEEHVVNAERVWFIEDEAEFLQLTIIRPLALGHGELSAVSVGFLVDANLRRKVRFWKDPRVRRVEANLTCERCRLPDCADRVAPASALDRFDERARKERALLELVGGSKI